jgi:DNA-binding CsgD family transcriptional regulator
MPESHDRTEASMSARSRGRARGGKHGAEPRSRIRLREIQVMDLMLEGRTQHQIAAAVGISQPAVSKILRRVEERLLADLAWKIERQRARHTVRLEFIYGEAIRAWQASKQEALRRRQRKTDGGENGEATVAEIVSENRHGDPRYLDEARKALSDLRNLWGVDAPERVSIEARTPYASMTDAALEAELERQTRLLKLPDAHATTLVHADDDNKGESHGE